MNATFFLINTVFGLYLMVVLLRFWLQLAGADFFNPFSQFIDKATHPLLSPLKRVLPSIGKINTAALVLAFALSLLQVFLVLSLFVNATVSPVTLVLAALANVFNEACYVLFWSFILRAILSWVSQGRLPIEFVLHQLTEPLMAPVRRFIPPMGGLDLSVLVILIALQFLQILLKDLVPLLRYL